MIPKRLTKSELKIRQQVALMEASGIDLTTREGRKDCFKRFADHNNQSIAAAKIRIIQKYAAIYNEGANDLKLDNPIFDKYAK